MADGVDGRSRWGRPFGSRNADVSVPPRRCPPRPGGCARGAFRAESSAALKPGSHPHCAFPGHEIRQELHLIAATQLKVGMVIMHNGKPHRVTNVLHVTPGNWRGMVQTRLVNIESGSNAEHRFRSEDKVDRANLEEHSLQFSYRAADEFHFMNTESYEMVSLHTDVLGDAVGYLTEGMIIQAQTFEGRVVGVDLPMFVELTVKETTPNIKGAAVQNTSKPAIMETGLEIKVPPYIESGSRVKIDTRTGAFVERA
jgi:elongation factor P